MRFGYPVDIKKYNIVQEFGYDNSNDKERSKFYKLFDNKHPGIDFSTPVGTDIYASFDGIVVRKEFHKGMGNVLGIRNGNIVALYAHLREFSVNLGDIVSSGQLLGLSGKTGAACITPHLHFELRDISRNSLKEMVFNPSFGKESKRHTETFFYKVNNKNTKKNLFYLSIMYFGTGNYWTKIAETNNLKLKKDVELVQGSKITIPNY